MAQCKFCKAGKRHALTMDCDEPAALRARIKELQTAGKQIVEDYDSSDAIFEQAVEAMRAALAKKGA